MVVLRPLGRCDCCETLHDAGGRSGRKGDEGSQDHALVVKAVRRIRYTIYQSTSKYGTYKKVKNVSGADSKEWTSGKLKKGTTYYYKIRPYWNWKKGKKIYRGKESKIIQKKVK